MFFLCRLLSAIKDTKRVMQDSSYYLLLEDKSKFKQDDAPYLDLVSKSDVSQATAFGEIYWHNSYII